jgi:predicted PurR-regulated permease PerM
MFKKFTKGLEHIKLFSSQYLTIVTFAGIILGGYKVYDKWNDSIKLVQEKVEIVMKNQESQKKIDSLLLQSQNNLRKEFEEHTKNIDRFEKQLQSLQKSYVRYISNDDALTKQDFLQYMEGLTLEEKKSFIDNNEIDTISSTTTRNAKIIVRKIEK